MISKELLSEVLGEDIETVMVNDRDNDDKDIYYCDFETCDFIDCETINIHELAHNCKDWALDKGYYLKTHIYKNTEYQTKAEIIVVYMPKYTSSMNTQRYADTEPEAIFKACEWILEQKDK